MPTASSSALSSTIIFSSAGLDWPDGSPLFSGISAGFGPGRTGLVGLNGSGKSTILRLITGELEPTTGSITVSGEVAYLAQTLTLQTDATVAALLGIADIVVALRAIEAGDAGQQHFDAVGDDWDIETRAMEALRAAGFDTDAIEESAGMLRRTVGELSGGEAVLVAIAGLRLRAAPVTLLDEPTNNLDAASLSRLFGLIRSWRGTLVVVSHNTALLDLMDGIVDLHDGCLTVFGGTYSDYRMALAHQQSAARQAERSAEQSLKVEKRQRVEAETVVAKRQRYAATDYANTRKPRAMMKVLARRAEVSAGKLRRGSDDRVQAATTAVDAAARLVRTDEHLRIDLPDPQVSAHRRLAELRGTDRTFVIEGQERVAVVGPNGIGKTTLLESLVHPGRAPSGGTTAASATAIALTGQIGYLAQRLDGLDEHASVLETVRAAAPNSTPGEIRNRLARFLIRGNAVGRTIRSLSGGERFRVVLASLLLADPPAQLLVLDEPTNNLDAVSVDQLVDALAEYRGGLLVVSHDEDFLARLEISTLLELDAAGRLVERDPAGLGAVSD